MMKKFDYKPIAAMIELNGAKHKKIDLKKNQITSEVGFTYTDSDSYVKIELFALFQSLYCNCELIYSLN